MLVKLLTNRQPYIQAIEEMILGNSLAIKEMKKLIEMVCPSNTTVLIQGETGTGKELVAEALHLASGRGAIIFLLTVRQYPLNC